MTSMSLENAAPQVHSVLGSRAADPADLDEAVQDPFDAREVFDLVRSVSVCSVSKYREYRCRSNIVYYFSVHSRPKKNCKYSHNQIFFSILRNSMIRIYSLIVPSVALFYILYKYLYHKPTSRANTQAINADTPVNEDLSIASILHSSPSWLISMIIPTVARAA